MAKSEIVKKIARGEVETEIALKQLKLLLAEFPDQNLLTWVNNELTGYKKDDTVPSYRITGGVLKGSVLNYTTHATNVGIPLSPDTPKEMLDICNKVIFRESIGELQTLLKKENGFVGTVVPPDYYPYIMKYSLMSITAILNASIQVGSTAISHIFSEVNNKILDILLLLEKEFGCLDALDIDLDSKTSEEIDIIQKQITVFVFNDNSINIGDDNKIKDSDFISRSALE